MKDIEITLKSKNFEIDVLVDIDTLDDDEPDIMYRCVPWAMDYGWNFPSVVPANEEEAKEWEEIIDTHLTDEEFLQFCADYHNEIGAEKDMGVYTQKVVG